MTITMSRGAWSAEETARCRDLAVQGHSQTEIATALRRPEGSVTTKLGKLFTKQERAQLTKALVARQVAAKRAHLPERCPADDFARANGAIEAGHSSSWDAMWAGKPPCSYEQALRGLTALASVPTR